ncbi:MAG: HDIG domain-containing protein [Candidatus Omnitrophica bacterium]|nr:HDIG domain-containing protein [Candidatus Omnitrophota bacterium]
MKNLLKIKIGYVPAGIVGGVILSLIIFCKVVGFPLLTPLLLLFLGIHLFLTKGADYRLFLHLGLLLALLVFTAHAFYSYTTISPYYIPVASIAMLTMLLFNDLQLALMMSFVGSAIVSLMVGGDLNLMVIFFLGNLTAAYVVRDARTRGIMIGAGFYIGIMHVAGVVFLNPSAHFLVSKTFALDYMRPLVINGFLSAGVVMATLKIFEYLFGVVTNFSLLEVSDFNQPLLKKMILEAPGTYHHSLIVSNMSEAAADVIDANALLTRVGAYYHDIGKMEKPEYFTENQIMGGNKHDNIEPSISRLVILNHVKEGLKLAQKNKLNPGIAEFISQHHGTSLMHYFYQKALEEAEDHDTIKEENYRYPGPKPQTRETAIVLLADSVEAATRSVDEPNIKKIEAVVRKIINNKFIDGQLDECNLTLKEIEIIATTFTRILGAMYHTRVKYPEKKNDTESRNPKSAETDTSQSPPDN